MPLLKIARCFFLLALCFASSSLAFAQPEVEKTQTTLLSDFDPAKPDAEFRLAVKFKIAPNWHIYWQYPGEFGLPTRINFKVPAGFKVGELQWPAPERFVQSGNQVGYGYSNEVVLFAKVSPAAGSKAAAADFVAEVKWLNCSASLCVPDSSELKLAELAFSEAVKDELDHWQGHVPVPISDNFSGLKVSQTGKLTDNVGVISLILEWSMEHGKVDFFPALPKDLELEDLFISQEGLQSLISFKIKRMAGILPQPSQGFTALIRPAADNPEVKVYSFQVNLN